MGARLRWVVAGTLLVSMGSVRPSEGYSNRVGEEQTLAGEVVALWCFLREGSFGTGRLNNTKQINCIRLGSPILIKVGEIYYTALVEEPALKNRLTALAGGQVTVRGKVVEQNGQPLLAISYVARAK